MDVFILEHIVPPKTISQEIDRKLYWDTLKSVKQKLFGLNYHVTGSGGLLDFGMNHEYNPKSDIDLIARDEDTKKEIVARLESMGFQKVPTSQQGLYVVRHTDGWLGYTKILPRTEWLVKEIGGIPFYVNVSPRRLLMLNAKMGEPLFGRYVIITPERGVIYKLLRGHPKDIAGLTSLANIGKLARILDDNWEILTKYAYRAIKPLKAIIRRTDNSEEQIALKERLEHLKEEEKRLKQEVGIYKYPLHKWSIPLDKNARPRLPRGEEIVISAGKLERYVRPLP